MIINKKFLNDLKNILNITLEERKEDSQKVIPLSNIENLENACIVKFDKNNYKLYSNTDLVGGYISSEYIRYSNKRDISITYYIENNKYELCINGTRIIIYDMNTKDELIKFSTHNFKFDITKDDVLIKL